MKGVISGGAVAKALAARQWLAASEESPARQCVQAKSDLVKPVEQGPVSREKAQNAQKFLWLWILREFEALHRHCGIPTKSDQIRPAEKLNPPPSRLLRGKGSKFEPVRLGQTRSNPVKPKTCSERLSEECTLV
jgi:hypothetical protein